MTETGDGRIVHVAHPGDDKQTRQRVQKWILDPLIIGSRITFDKGQNVDVLINITDIYYRLMRY